MGKKLTQPAGQQCYRDRLIKYRKQWSHELQTITGQGGEIPMLTYQTLGPAGEARLLAADKDPGIAALLFEVFVEIGFEIQERSPFEDTFVFGLANRGLGYLLSPRLHALGSYETWLTVAHAEVAASPKLVEKLTERLRRTHPDTVGK